MRGDLYAVICVRLCSVINKVRNIYTYPGAAKAYLAEQTPVTLFMKPDDCVMKIHRCRGSSRFTATYGIRSISKGENLMNLPSTPYIPIFSPFFP